MRRIEECSMKHKQENIFSTNGPIFIKFCRNVTHWLKVIWFNFAWNIISINLQYINTAILEVTVSYFQIFQIFHTKNSMFYIYNIQRWIGVSYKLNKLWVFSSVPKVYYQWKILLHTKFHIFLVLFFILTLYFSKQLLLVFVVFRGFFRNPQLIKMDRFKHFNSIHKELIAGRVYSTLSFSVKKICTNIFAISLPKAGNKIKDCPSGSINPEY